MSIQQNYSVVGEILHCRLIPRTVHILLAAEEVTSQIFGKSVMTLPLEKCTNFQPNPLK